MTWLFPAFLAGAFAVAVPILLHLLRRRPRRFVVFPSLRFLAATQRRSEQQHNVQRWIVLALRCAALALIAAAFARPFFGRNDGTTTRAVIVVIDNSFSLQAGDRWPALRTWANEQVGLLAPGDKLGLLLLGPRPRWLVAPQGNTAETLSLLAHLDPGWETGRAQPALRLAADTLAATPAGERRLVFLGDHQRVSWMGADFGRKFPGGITAVFPQVPGPLKRQAALQAPKLLPLETGLRATLQVRNFTGPQSRRLRVYRDQALTPVLEMSLELGERETRLLQLDLPAGPAGYTQYRFSLDADDLPTDDTAYAVWQAAGENVVMLDPGPADTAADYVASALESSAALPPGIRLAPAGSWPSQAVAVLRRKASFSGTAAARLDGFLRNGGAALVFVDGSADQLAWFAAHGVNLRAQRAGPEPLHVHEWSMDHPVVAALAEQQVTPLLGWDFRRGWGLPPNAVEPLALWTENAAAIGEFRVGAGVVLVCGFTADRRDSDWPLHPAFVPFVHRAVTWLLGAPQGAAAREVRVGTALALPGESGTWRLLDGPESGLPGQTVNGSVVPAMPGVYEFASGVERRLFAVNLPPEESDPAAWDEGTPWTELMTPGAAPADRARPRLNLAALEAEQQAPLWWGLVAAAALLLIAELGLANRTMR